MKTNFNNILDEVLTEAKFDYKKSYLDFEKEQEAKEKTKEEPKKPQKELSATDKDKLIREISATLKDLSPTSIQDLKKFVNTLKKRDLYSDNETLDIDDDEEEVKPKPASKPKSRTASKPKKKEDTSFLGKVGGFVKGMVPTQGSLAAKSEDELNIKIKDFKKQYPAAYVSKPQKLNNKFVVRFQYFGDGQEKKSNVKKTMSKLK